MAKTEAFGISSAEAAAVLKRLAPLIDNRAAAVPIQRLMQEAYMQGARDACEIIARHNGTLNVVDEKDSGQ